MIDYLLSIDDKTLALICGLFIVLVAVTLHEAGHAYASKWLGDDTAERMGRASLLPWRHFSPVGTILLPAFLIANGLPAIGWAKGVPVKFDRLRNPRWGALLVALAGPAMNLLQLLIAVIVLAAGRALGWLNETVIMGLLFVVIINAVLIIFNMMPFPPLDGSRVLTAFFPRLAEPFHRLQSRGILILLGLFIILPLLADTFKIDFNPSTMIRDPAMNAAYWVEALARPTQND